MSASSKRVIGVILARGSSEELPRKNILPLGGKPLIAWTIEAANRSSSIDRTIVSTDDPEIARVAQSLGGDVPFLRPPQYATRQASIESAILNLLDTLEKKYEYVVALQPTSPFRSGADIDACVAACSEYRCGSCVTVVEVDKSPYQMLKLGQDGKIEPLIGSGSTFLKRRQDLPKVYRPNGAVYAAQTAYLRKFGRFYGPETRAVRMPKERSIDIDTRLDLMLAQCLVKQLGDGQEKDKVAL